MDIDLRLTPDTYKVFKAVPEEWTEERLVRAALSREIGLTPKSITRRIATLKSLNLIEVQWPKGLGVTPEIRRREFEEHA